MVALTKLTKIARKKIDAFDFRKQMKNRPACQTVRVKQMNAWMHDDELESRRIHHKVWTTTSKALLNIF